MPERLRECTIEVNQNLDRGLSRIMMDKRRVHDRQDTDVQRRVQGSGGAGKDYGAKSQAEIAREHRFKPDILARWERQFLENASSLFEKERSNHEAEARIAELEQALGRKTLELEVAKKPRASSPGSTATDGPRVG